jgi:ABC-2 type transport system permease protein
MLFIMPLAMIIIMAIVQDVPFRDYQDVGFKVLWCDDDQKSVSDSLINYLAPIKQIELVKEIKKNKISRSELKNRVERGDFPVGIYIPRGFNASIFNKVNRIVNYVGKANGNPAIYPVNPALDSIKMQLYFDPGSKNTYRIALKQSIDKLLFRLEYDILISRLSNGRQIKSGSENEKNLFNPAGGVEVVASQNEIHYGIVNSVQHNVPAWIVFALFFLVMPIAGNYIKEKDEGNKVRVSMTPGSYLDILLGKVLFYCTLGIIQFIFLFISSKLILPSFGLPDLIIGQHAFLLIIDAVIITLPAITLGYLIGVLFRTYHQAMMFASILIIILSALGGIWIPVAVLPHWMQQIANISPLHWSLELINDTLLRTFNLSTWLFKAAVLTGFGILFILLSQILHSRKIA